MAAWRSEEIVKNVYTALARRSKNEAVWKWLRSVLFALLPTWILLWIPQSRVTLKHERRVQKTVFLDGLRGVASVIVVAFHHTSTFGWPRYFQEPYYLGPYEEGKDPRRYTSWLQLPIVRVLHSGRAMIAIFFVISGYVLSFRQVRMIRSSSYDELGNSLFSSTFRRPFRLFLPSIVGVALWHQSVQLQWQYEKPPKRQPFGSWTGTVNGMATLFKASWYLDRGPPETKPDIRQLWTIPVEFAGSMVVFLLLSGTSRLPTWIRISIIICVMENSLASGFWGIFVFVAGMMIAEFEAMFEDNGFEPRKKTHLLRSAVHNIFWAINLIIGLFIAGYPHVEIERDPWLAPLLKYTPKWYYNYGGLLIHYFWISISAVQIVWSLFRLPMLQKIFTTKIALYLGDVSYSLYIVHYYIVLPMSLRMHSKADRIFGQNRSSHLSQLVAIVFELIPIYFVCFWQADLFWRYVDRPCVKFAKWLEKKVRK